MLISNKSKKIIRLIFEESKPIHVERLLALLLVSVVSLTIAYFFGKLSIYVGMIVAIVLDNLLLKYSSRIFPVKGATLYQATLPLEYKEKFQIKLFENLINNGLTYLFGTIVFLVAVDMLNSRPVLTVVFVFIQCVLFSSMPMRYGIIDQDTSFKKRTLKQLLVVFIQIIVLLTLIPALIFDVNLFFTSVEFLELRIGERGFLVSLFMFIDLAIIYKIMENEDKISNEHKKYDFRKRTLKQNSIDLAKVYGAVILINILLIPVFVFTSSHSKTSYKYASLLKLKKNTLYEAFKKVDVKLINTELERKSKWSSEYKWFDEEARANIFMKQIDFKNMKPIIGEDVKNWDHEFCSKILGREKCSKNILLDYAIKYNGRNIQYNIIKTKDYPIDDKKAMELYISSAQKCLPGIFLGLNKRGVKKEMTKKERFEFIEKFINKKTKDCKTIIKNLVVI